MTTAFVLSGGASLGSVQVGMLRALYERGIAPDLILGTSVGAVNAAYISSRPQTIETADGLAEVWHGIGTTTIFPVDPLVGLMGLLGAKDHFISNRGLRKLIESGISFERLEHAEIPTAMIATDARTGHDRRLMAGDGVEATLASAAIPAVYPTIAWDDTRLMDGGVANNTPLSHAIELGADEVYVLPSGFSCDLDRSPRGALASGVHALTLLIGSRLAAEVERFEEADVAIHLLPPPCPIDVQPVDFRKTRELIERSAAVAREFLDGERPERPDTTVLRPHRHGAAVPAQPL